MLSIDTNVLLYAQNQDCPEHDAAVAFLVDCADRDDVAICELVLLELYQLLRNPAVVTRPLEAPEAAEVCQTLRHHGVDEFATRNVNDFPDFGFSRVWDPITTVH